MTVSKVPQTQVSGSDNTSKKKKIDEKKEKSKVSVPTSSPVVQNETGLAIEKTVTNETAKETETVANPETRPEKKEPETKEAEAKSDDEKQIGAELYKKLGSDIAEKLATDKELTPDEFNKAAEVLDQVKEEQKEKEIIKLVDTNIENVNKSGAAKNLDEAAKSYLRQQNNPNADTGILANRLKKELNKGTVLNKNYFDTLKSVSQKKIQELNNKLAQKVASLSEKSEPQDEQEVQSLVGQINQHRQETKSADFFNKYIDLKRFSANYKDDPNNIGINLKDIEKAKTSNWITANQMYSAQDSLKVNIEEMAEKAQKNGMKAADINALKSMLNNTPKEDLHPEKVESFKHQLITRGTFLNEEQKIKDENKQNQAQALEKIQKEMEGNGNISIETLAKMSLMGLDKPDEADTTLKGIHSIFKLAESQGAKELGKKELEFLKDMNEKGYDFSDGKEALKKYTQQKILEEIKNEKDYKTYTTMDYSRFRSGEERFDEKSLQKFVESKITTNNLYNPAIEINTFVKGIKALKSLKTIDNGHPFISRCQNAGCDNSTVKSMVEKMGSEADIVGHVGETVAKCITENENLKNSTEHDVNDTHSYNKRSEAFRNALKTYKNDLFFENPNNAETQKNVDKSKFLVLRTT